MTKDMSIPQAGKEGYLIKVTPENYLELFKMVPSLEPQDTYVNYDPEWESILIVVSKDSARKSVFTETTLITVEELKLLLFIRSLEE